MSINFLQTSPITITSPTVSTNIDTWGSSQLLETVITETGVEQVFRQDSLILYTSTYFSGSQPHPRIYKVVYEIIEGKIQKVREVEGRYLPPTEESYEFE